MRSDLVNAVVDKLETAGFSLAPTPFKVASVNFEFTAAMVGSVGRALDLVLIIDTAMGDHGDRDPLRVRQRIEALSRALDITSSRYVLTTVLVGATLSGAVDALSATCRVLTVENVTLDSDGKPANDAARQALEDQIRVLLPLKITFEETDDLLDTDPVLQLTEALPAGTNLSFLARLAAASQSGEDSVTTELAAALNEALKLGADQ